MGNLNLNHIKDCNYLITYLHSYIYMCARQEHKVTMYVCMCMCVCTHGFVQVVAVCVYVALCQANLTYLYYHKELFPIVF